MKKMAIIIGLLLSLIVSTVAFAEDFKKGNAANTWNNISSAKEGSLNYLVQNNEKLILKGSVSTSGSGEIESTELIPEISSYSELSQKFGFSFKIVRAYRSFAAGTHMSISKLVVKGVASKYGFTVASVKTISCGFDYDYTDMRCNDVE